MNGQKMFYKKGNATVGLLIMVLFIMSLVLFNSPDLNLTNRVAHAYGTAFLGGGAVTIDHVATLTGIAATPITTLTAGQVTGLTVYVQQTTTAISGLANANLLVTNKAVAVAAVRQVLKAVIYQTIIVIQKRITELSV